MSLSLITRADDFGTSHSANIAIAEAAMTGAYIRNISCMAVGSWIDQGADLLHNRQDICLGLHATLNAEWDPLRWGPISAPEAVPSLVDQQGTFYNDPAWFVAHPPDLDQVLGEYDHQLDLLTNLGLDIRYVDSHMLPELFVPGLAEAVNGWAERKGLINHLGFYRFPARLEPGPNTTFEMGLQAFLDWLDLLEQGTYLSVMHPARASREMLLCRNARVPAGVTSTCRDVDYRLLLSHQLEQACDERGIKRLRYDEAEPQGTTFEQLRQIFLNGTKENLDEQ